MAYKSIDERFWTDPKVRRLPVNEKLLLLYFITNPYTHYSGIYYMPLSVISEETGLPSKSIKNGLKILTIASFVQYDYEFNMIWVVKMASYQLGNIKNEDKKYKGVANHFDTLHNCPLINKFLNYYPDYPIEYKPLVSPLQAPSVLSEAPSITEAVKETVTEEEEVTVTAISALTNNIHTQVIEYLNQVLSTNYKTSTKTTIDLIKARVEQGHDLKDFKIVIDKKYAEWAFDPEYSKFLRPETLFGNKFEGYLNQKAAGKKKSKNELRIAEIMDAERN